MRNVYFFKIEFCSTQLKRKKKKKKKHENRVYMDYACVFVFIIADGGIYEEAKLLKFEITTWMKK